LNNRHVITLGGKSVYPQSLQPFVVLTQSNSNGKCENAMFAFMLVLKKRPAKPCRQTCRRGD
jgi:hypothetical protein